MILLIVLTGVVSCYVLTVVAALNGFLTQSHVVKIGVPLWYICVALLVLSLIRIHKRPFGWIFGSSLVALFFWTNLVLFH